MSLQNRGLPLASRESGPTAYSLSTSDRLLDVKEAAGLLKVPESWIYQHVRAREEDKLPHFKLGKYLRFSTLALTQWLESHHIGSETKPLVVQRRHSHVRREQTSRAVASA